jgi:hypothetical protein
VALTAAEELRQMLGEVIPEGGSDQDTLFTDPQIENFLTHGGNNLDLAAYHGWVAKSAALANLVDTQEGSSRRAMSKLHDNAQKQVTFFATLSGVLLTNPTRGRTRIGNITRRPQ